MMSHCILLVTIKSTGIDRMFNLEAQGPCRTLNESEEAEEEENKTERTGFQASGRRP